MQLINCYFVIQIDGCMYNFDCADAFVWVKIFAVKLVNNKVVDNLLIYLVFNFHSHRT